MDNNKKPGEKLDRKWRSKQYVDADAIFNDYHGIRKTLLCIQIVQIVQGITLLLIALLLLSK